MDELKKINIDDEIINRYANELKEASDRAFGDDACMIDYSCGSNVELLKIEPGEYVIDLGCGTGEEVLAASLLVGSNGKAIGLDMTPEMLEKAVDSSSCCELNNTEFVLGDIDSLPFEDNFADAIMSNCVINHAEDKSKVYEEIFRVLKPGGRFVISEPVSVADLPDEIKNDPQKWGECFGGVVTLEEYMNSINAAGFRIVEILNRREYIKNGFDFISLTIRAVK